MSSMGSGVKAHCTNCGNYAPADQFKLHYQFKKMVCPSCFTGRTEEKQKKEAEVKAPKAARPPGWDAVDDYLEKAARLKKQDGTSGRFTQIPGSSQVQYECISCKYTFKYDPFKKQPRNCPYCNVDIPKMKTFNLL